jgi:hypothetical protein
MNSKLISVPINTILPGQTFQYLGQKYVRAQKDQLAKHPSQELVAQREPGSLVLAYSLVYKRDGTVTKTPVSIAVGIDFIPTVVWIKRGVQE